MQNERKHYYQYSIRNMKRAEDNVATMEKEEKENAEALEKIEKEFKRLEDDATKVLEAFREAELEMQDMEGQLEASKGTGKGMPDHRGEKKGKSILQVPDTGTSQYW